jgi:hypothetical protein
VIFAGLTMYDFQRLRRTKDLRAASLFAASIFLDALNVFTPVPFDLRKPPLARQPAVQHRGHTSASRVRVPEAELESELSRGA